MLEDLRHILIGLPGAKSVSWANAALIEKQGYSDALVLNDHPKPAGAPAFVFWRTAATPEYFDSLGIRLIAGRSFNDSDRSGTEPVSIISESTAKRFLAERERRWQIDQAILGTELEPSGGRSEIGRAHV